MKTLIDSGVYTEFYEKIGSVAEEVKYPVFHWCVIAGINDADTIQHIDNAFKNPESPDAGPALFELFKKLEFSDITIDATTKSKDKIKNEREENAK